MSENGGHKVFFYERKRLKFMIRVTAPQLTVLHYVVSILLTKILRYYFVTYYL